MGELGRGTVGQTVVACAANAVRVSIRVWAAVSMFCLVGLRLAASMSCRNLYVSSAVASVPRRYRSTRHVSSGSWNAGVALVDRGGMIFGLAFTYRSDSDSGMCTRIALWSDPILGSTVVVDFWGVGCMRISQ